MIESIAVIHDPRKNINLKYSIQEIVVLSVFAVVAGCDSWVEIEDFGHEKLDWLNKIINFKNGVPSHDTISRVFTLIAPTDLQKLFCMWGQKKFKKNPKHIAIDGKALKATSGEKGKFSYLAVISAWASEEGVCLGEVLSTLNHEKKAFRDVIENLNLKDTTVTMDANGLVASTLHSIKKQKGDFLVALKEPQLALKKQVFKEFEERPDETKVYEETSKGHGRLEYRGVEVLDLKKEFNEATKAKRKKCYEAQMPEFNSCIRVLSKRMIKGKPPSQEVRYYLSSRKNLSAEEAFKLVRSHWSIENNLHWSLDVTFNEDRCTVKDRRSALNFSSLRRFSLSILKSDKSKKSIRLRRKSAGWSEDYLLKVVKGFCQG